MRLSLIIPTYNEKENILILIQDLEKEFKSKKIKGEIIIIDDNSPDGTGQIAEELKKEHGNIKVIHREGKLGLSSAVLDGFKSSKGDILGVMDADRSHPANKIYEMYNLIKNKKADFVIGSRYIIGGKIEGWGLYRKCLSKGATLLARVFTNVKDPMTGFFMIKKECIKDIELNPKGFKILLEILIKARYNNVMEIPIVFTNRTAGKSKAGLKEIFFYLRNLLGYLSYKKRIMSEFFKFASVGFIGTIINLIILYFFTETLGVYYLFSAVISFIIAMTSNFILNKVWTFKEKIKLEVSKKYVKFILVSVTALMVNLFFLYIFTEFFGIYYMISQIIAIGLALIINFLGNKIWTFSK